MVYIIEMEFQKEEKKFNEWMNKFMTVALICGFEVSLSYK